MNEVNLVDLQVIENVYLVNAINWTADAEIYLRTRRSGVRVSPRRNNSSLEICRILMSP
jgi:hypothetical protein